MRILFVSDAWEPQVNGVVRTIQMTKRELEARGHAVAVIGPNRFRTLPLPSYPEIRLALARQGRLGKMIAAFAPDTIHIATEGPLGWAARRWCLRNDVKFTTAYHTRFPEYLARRAPVPPRLCYALLRRFHAPSAAVMVATGSLAADLKKRGFGNVTSWTRGVDTDLFRPTTGGLPNLPRPILLYAGRVAVEKNLRAFLALDLPGTKAIVGDGPQLAALKRDYPTAHFTGALHGAALAAAYTAADVFVFPSLTDTFGLVLVEALACGAPVAGFAADGPRDVLAPQPPSRPVGVTGTDLKAAILECLRADIPPERCRAFVETHYTWRAATDQFLDTVMAICDELTPS